MRLLADQASAAAADAANSPLAVVAAAASCATPATSPVPQSPPLTPLPPAAQASQADSSELAPSALARATSDALLELAGSSESSAAMGIKTEAHDESKKGEEASASGPEDVHENDSTGEATGSTSTSSAFYGKLPRNKRRRVEDISEHEIWKCMNTSCTKIYKRTSTISINNHRNICQFRPQQTTYAQPTNFLGLNPFALTMAPVLPIPMALPPSAQIRRASLHPPQLHRSAPQPARSLIPIPPLASSAPPPSHPNSPRLPQHLLSPTLSYQHGLGSPILHPMRSSSLGQVWPIKSEAEPSPLPMQFPLSRPQPTRALSDGPSPYQLHQQHQQMQMEMQHQQQQHQQQVAELQHHQQVQHLHHLHQQHRLSVSETPLILSPAPLVLTSPPTTAVTPMLAGISRSPSALPSPLLLATPLSVPSPPFSYEVSVPVASTEDEHVHLARLMHQNRIHLEQQRQMLERQKSEMQLLQHQQITQAHLHQQHHAQAQMHQAQAIHQHQQHQQQQQQFQQQQQHATYYLHHPAPHPQSLSPPYPHHPPQHLPPPASQQPRRHQQSQAAAAAATANGHHHPSIGSPPSSYSQF